MESKNINIYIFRHDDKRKFNDLFENDKQRTLKSINLASFCNIPAVSSLCPALLARPLVAAGPCPFCRLTGGSDDLDVRNVVDVLLSDWVENVTHEL